MRWDGSALPQFSVVARLAFLASVVFRFVLQDRLAACAGEADAKLGRLIADISG
jgi:hypothetical protein